MRWARPWSKRWWHETLARAQGTAGVRKLTWLDALRGRFLEEELEPASPPCHPTDMLTAGEVAAVRGCSTKVVYKRRRQGRLLATPTEPYQFYGSSVLEEMGW